ncbi:baseplate hub protein [Aestuariivirga sp.]|uniref:baseplate hub domain-containing protein n=1 Tax=Aestuariivirga sp. TaxID=2650926 RepID=UPI0039E50816
MKTLPDGMQDHLDSGVTTLCHCWRVRLVTGETLGFTDHDQPLAFDGTLFEAQAGFTGSEIEVIAGARGRQSRGGRRAAIGTAR